MTRRKLHHTCIVGRPPFAARVRARFGNSAACNLMVSRDGPGDETPSSSRAYGIFRSDRPCRFSGSSRLAFRPNQGEAHARKCEMSQNQAKYSRRKLFCHSCLRIAGDSAVLKSKAKFSGSLLLTAGCLYTDRFTRCLETRYGS
jgi:hypothetical protein